MFFFLNNCGGGFSDFKKTMSGEKITTNDEFLIKKKDPLSLPPQYEKLPIPNTKQKTLQSNSIETVLGSSKNKDQKIIGTSSIEKIILEELKK